MTIRAIEAKQHPEGETSPLAPDQAETSFTADKASLDEACIRTRGERLAWLRERAGLSLTAAAGVMGISKAELSRVENGIRNITGKHMARAANAYGVGFAHLRTLLNHDPRAETAVFQITEPAASPRTRPLPCYGGQELKVQGPSPSHRIDVPLPGAADLGPTAYGVRLPSEACFASSHHTMIAVVDPEARCVLGDPAVNPFGWAPLIGTTARDESGRLVLLDEHGVAGTVGETVRVSDLHKVVLVLPDPME
jgi:transcriptional regulator with XRE-family HTH domain